MFIVVASVFTLSRILSTCSGAVAGIAWIALSAVLAICVATVEEYRGVVNKFLSDGLLAVFGAPLPSENPAQDARRSVEASGRILEALDAARSARSVPDLDVGIGVHCGEAVVGTVGPSDRRD